MKVSEFFDKMFSSLDNHTAGFSGRKLSALAAVIMASYVTIFMLPAAADDVRLHALYAWLAFALLCLGIVTIQQVIELKNGRSNEPTS